MFAGTTIWAQAAATAFPGVAWVDPGFLRPGQSPDRFPPPQLVMDGVVAALVVLSAWRLRPGAGPAEAARRPRP